MLACIFASKMLLEFANFDLKNGGRISGDSCRCLKR